MNIYLKIIAKKPLIIYLGLFLLVICDVQSQSEEELRARLSEKVDGLVQEYYFTQPDSAILLLEPLAAEARENGFWDQVLYIAINQASIASDIENNSLFSNYLKKADSILAAYPREIEKHDENGYIRANLHFLYGRFYYDQFNFEDAIDNYSKVFSLEASIQDSLLAYDTYLSIGQANYSLGNFESALHAYKLAQISLPLTHETYSAGRDYEYRQAFINSLLGRAHYFEGEKTGNKGSLWEAIKMYHTSLNLLRGKEEDKSAQRLYSTLYGRLATGHSELMNHDSAIFYLEKMFSRISDSPVDQIQSYLLGGEIYLSALKSGNAMSYYEQASEIAALSFKDNNNYKGKALTGIGRVYALNKDFEAAISYYRKAASCFTTDSWNKNGSFLPALNDIKNENDMLMLLESMGTATFHQFSQNKTAPDQCLAIYKLASSLSDQLRIGFQSAESRQLLASRTTGIYEGAVAAAYEAFQTNNLSVDYQNTFLYFLEKNKGAQLLEASRDAFAKTFTGKPQVWLERENSLKGEIAYLKRIINEAKEEDPLLRRNLDDAYKKYNNFTASLQAKFPEYFKIKYKTDIISVNELQEIIPDNTLFLEYLFGSDALYIFSATNTDMHIEKVPRVKEVQKHLSAVLDAIKEPTSTEMMDASYSLNKLIFKPILEKYKGIEKLWIVPDGLLGYLPFEVLVQNMQEKDGNDFPHYLIQDFAIKYEFSGTLIKEKLTLPKEARDNNYLGFAPDYKSSQGISEQRFALTPLKFNRQEVKEANQVFGGLMFLNKTATEENFFKHAGESDILHLSMHAMANDENPIYSAFYFGNSSLGSEIDKRRIDENDGVLHLYELYNYPLNASLAVLSACETGSGNYAKGEGIMSLGRAFQYAGCPSVVMSLWQINDNSTAAIMEHFFRNLNKGMTKDDALRKSKLTFLNNPGNKFFSHPYYWSAFILVGDATPISQNIISDYTVVVGLAGFLIFLIIVFIMYKKRTGVSSK